ncbi:MAG: hypothetical protein OXT67_00570 [Zetaproteobacteria bacterium]|nr:hypothetical protein [Zetaproteobacteria bacterium]
MPSFALRLCTFIIGWISYGFIYHAQGQHPSFHDGPSMPVYQVYLRRYHSVEHIQIAPDFPGMKQLADTAANTHELLKGIHTQDPCKAISATVGIACNLINMLFGMIGIDLQDAFIYHTGNPETARPDTFKINPLLVFDTLSNKNARIAFSQATGIYDHYSIEIRDPGESDGTYIAWPYYSTKAEDEQTYQGNYEEIQMPPLSSGQYEKYRRSSIARYDAEMTRAAHIATQMSAQRHLALQIFASQKNPFATQIHQKFIDSYQHHNYSKKSIHQDITKYLKQHRLVVPQVHHLVNAIYSYQNHSIALERQTTKIRKSDYNFNLLGSFWGENCATDKCKRINTLYGTQFTAQWIGGGERFFKQARKYAQQHRCMPTRSTHQKCRSISTLRLHIGFEFTRMLEEVIALTIDSHQMYHSLLRSKQQKRLRGSR